MAAGFFSSSCRILEPHGCADRLDLAGVSANRKLLVESEGLPRDAFEGQITRVGDRWGVPMGYLTPQTPRFSCLEERCYITSIDWHDFNYFRPAP
jgi:hypothetical protein